MTLWTIAHQASLTTEFSRQECWIGYPFLSPGYLPHPGIEPKSPALQVNSLPSEPPGKPWLWESFGSNLAEFQLKRNHMCSPMRADIQVADVLCGERVRWSWYFWNTGRPAAGFLATLSPHSPHPQGLG